MGDTAGLLTLATTSRQLPSVRGFVKETMQENAGGKSSVEVIDLAAIRRCMSTAALETAYGEVGLSGRSSLKDWLVWIPYTSAIDATSSFLFL